MQTTAAAPYFATAARRHQEVTAAGSRVYNASRGVAGRLDVRTRRLTVGQAVVEFLIVQQTRRDGAGQAFFAGVFGIFGHGNVAGLGEALLAARDRLRFYLPRNEQAMVHTAPAFAKMRNRLPTFAFTSSIGPRAPNMLTPAAGPTSNPP